ncbi:MAG: 30S ribosomal protein S17e [Nanoarchaeota archaeon]|nr:30S ribosomal protein S17e [Nanoarchaeota archaeon]
MGRIKSTLIKKTATQLMDGFDGFSEDFEYNKKVLKGTMPSKSIRNKVAGYISRLVRQDNLKYG